MPKKGLKLVSLETRIHGAADSGNIACLGRSVHEIAISENVQPAD